MGNAHLEKWHSLVDEFREKARQLELEEHNNCAARTADDRVKVAEAQRFMETSCIGEALCALVWDVRRFAAWSSTNKRLSIPSEYSNLQIVADNMKDFAVSFTYRGQRDYGITFKEHSFHFDANGDSRGEAYLSAAGKMVFGVSAASRAGAEYDDWHPTTIEAFRPGHWIADLLEMHGGCKRMREASYAKFRDQMTGRRSSMIILESDE